MMSGKKSISVKMINFVVIFFAIIILTLILLSASNYSVQWRHQVDQERRQYLAVFGQAIEYYFLENRGVALALPLRPTLISNRDNCQHYCAIYNTELSCFNLEQILVPGYMKEILQDPFISSDSNSGFYIYQTSDQLILGACNNFYQPIQVSSTLEH
jgi:hypothetical protein